MLNCCEYRYPRRQDIIDEIWPVSYNEYLLQNHSAYCSLDDQSAARQLIDSRLLQATFNHSNLPGTICPVLTVTIPSPATVSNQPLLLALGDLATSGTIGSRPIVLANIQRLQNRKAVLSLMTPYIFVDRDSTKVFSQRQSNWSRLLLRNLKQPAQIENEAFEQSSMLILLAFAILVLKRHSNGTSCVHNYPRVSNPFNNFRTIAPLTKYPPFANRDSGVVLLRVTGNELLNGTLSGELLTCNQRRKDVSI